MDDQVGLERRLIAGFTAGARPLSSAALHSMVDYVSSCQEDVDEVIKLVLSKLTLGRVVEVVTVH
jgi:hypothetical protein